MIVQTTHSNLNCNQLKRCENAQSIIRNFAKALNSIEIYCPSFSDAIDVIKDCKKENGTVITTGMGKAGAAMRKFSSLLCSLGIPSCYIHPGESSHGDLGLITKNDILFVASTSGKTREVLEIIALSRNIGIKQVIGITSHLDSPIREKANIVLDMGEFKEEGHLGLAPTTSILIMLAITDALALTIAEENGLTKEEYSKFHHSGYLGSIARGDGEIR